MGHYRFRKSAKILPGVKVNFNKKSTSVSFGGKGAHYTISSTGKRTATVGIPGTGLYYSESSSSNSQKRKSSTANPQLSSAPPKSDLEKAIKRLKTNRNWIIVQFIFIVLSLCGGGYLSIVLWAGIALYLYKVRRPKLEIVKNSEEMKAIKLQELITCAPSSHLTYEPAQLTAKAYETVSSTLESVNKSFGIMEKAKLPSEFFNEYDLLLENIEKLIRFEPYIDFVDAKPTDLADAIKNEKDELFFDFVKRYYEDTKKKADTLVTDKGRNGRYQRYHDDLVPYYPYLNDDCIDYIEQTYSDSIVT